jgi:hypothetical protein
LISVKDGALLITDGTASWKGLVCDDVDSGGSKLRLGGRVADIQRFIARIHTRTYSRLHTGSRDQATVSSCKIVS